MTVSINGTSGLVFNDASTQNTAATGFGFKNRLINSAMMIDQRNAGASVTPTAGQYTLDRWQALNTQSSKFTVQQNAGSVTPPAGFKNYLGVTSSSSYSVVSGDYFAIRQGIEGLNMADLGWGTANASPVTLSFWVRSSLTGTFGGSIFNNGDNRSYPFSYTISAANTWEQKSVTIAGDTSGTWLTTNGTGAWVSFSIGTGTTYSGTAGSWAGSLYLSATGATSVVGTSGATFYITGVQLEKGSTATSFDYRPYGTELALCQRYCIVLSREFGNSRLFGFNYSNSASLVRANFPVQVRTGATGVIVTTAVNTFTLYQNGTTATISSIGFDTGDAFGANLSLGATVTANAGCILALNSSGNKIEFTGMEL